MTAITHPVESQGSQLSQTATAQPGHSYADLADLALAAPIVAHVQVRRSVPLRNEDAGAGVPAGHRRFYIESNLLSLIRGPDEMPVSVSYLVDLPNNERGRAARIAKRAEYLLLAAPVAGRPGELRLVARDALLAYSPETADRVRAILREAIAPGAPPRITGIGRAFHVSGSLPGESETQVFLQTSDNRPISLSVRRRPGELPAWSVALGEVVDEAAGPPQRDTLLWYRLACTLPRSLPAASLADASAEEGRAILGDYMLVMQRLGPCTRSRNRA
jgi:hypothetical protein